MLSPPILRLCFHFSESQCRCSWSPQRCFAETRIGEAAERLGSTGETTPPPAPQKLNIWGMYLDGSLTASSEFESGKTKAASRGQGNSLTFKRSVSCWQVGLLQGSLGQCMRPLVFFHSTERRHLWALHLWVTARGPSCRVRTMVRNFSVLSFSKGN